MLADYSGLAERRIARIDLFEYCVWMTRVVYTNGDRLAQDISGCKRVYVEFVYKIS